MPSRWSISWHTLKVPTRPQATSARTGAGDRCAPLEPLIAWRILRWVEIVEVFPTRFDRVENPSHLGPCVATVRSLGEVERDPTSTRTLRVHVSRSIAHREFLHDPCFDLAVAPKTPLRDESDNVSRHRISLASRDPTSSDIPEHWRSRAPESCGTFAVLLDAVEIAQEI